MEIQLIKTIVYGIFAAGAIFAGSYVLLHDERWAKQKTVYFISFSAGVVLATAFLHLLPEAAASYKDTFLVALVTILAFYVMEHTITIHTCKEGDCEVHTIGAVAFAGLLFHSFLDGIILGVSMEAHFAVGLAVTLGIMLHKFPVGITITSLLMHSGYTRKNTIIMSSCVALATPLGAIMAYGLTQGMTDSTMGLLLAIGAGSFVYIGASDLIPETHKNFNKTNIALVLGGVLLVYLISHFLGGGHINHDGHGHESHTESHIEKAVGDNDHGHGH